MQIFFYEIPIEKETLESCHLFLKAQELIHLRGEEIA
jgi:hypothetical protein